MSKQNHIFFFNSSSPNTSYSDIFIYQKSQTIFLAYLIIFK